MRPSFKISNIIDFVVKYFPDGNSVLFIQLSDCKRWFFTEFKDRRLTRLESILEVAEKWTPIPRWDSLLINKK